MSSMKSRLPGKKDSDIDAFIAGAENKTGQKLYVEKPQSYPWEEPGVREDVTKVYNLRLARTLLIEAEIHC